MRGTRGVEEIWKLVLRTFDQTKIKLRTEGIYERGKGEHVWLLKKCKEVVVELLQWACTEIYGVSFWRVDKDIG